MPETRPGLQYFPAFAPTLERIAAPFRPPKKPFD